MVWIQKDPGAHPYCKHTSQEPQRFGAIAAKAELANNLGISNIAWARKGCEPVSRNSFGPRWCSKRSGSHVGDAGGAREQLPDYVVEESAFAAPPAEPFLIEMHMAQTR